MVRDPSPVQLIENSTGYIRVRVTSEVPHDSSVLGIVQYQIRWDSQDLSGNLTQAGMVGSIGAEFGKWNADNVDGDAQSSRYERPLDDRAADSEIIAVWQWSAPKFR